MPTNQVTVTKKTIIDEDTGERYDVQEVYKELKIGEKQFWKLYLADFLSILGLLESKQLDVLVHIMEHMQPSTNMYVGTYRGLAKACNVSTGTIADVMRKLIQAKFLVKIQNGLYQINPDYIMKGGDSKKAMLIRYRNEAMADSDCDHDT